MGVLASIGRREEAATDVFAMAGAFLRAHRLTPDPANYAIAHAVVSDPDGVIAREVARLTDGGIRLAAEDVARMGGVAATGLAVAADTSAPPDKPAPADALVARTQAQVEGFRDTVQAMSQETQDFGRDLAAALEEHDAAALIGAMGPGIDTIARLATAMIARTRLAETRLAAATREVDELRGELEEAWGSARSDPLTGLPNRRAFDEAWAARTLQGGDAALAIVDIDRFKQVNDRFGHTVGDRVLKVIGTALAEGCPDGIVARFGGEEFVMLFPSLEEARRRVEATRERVAARRLKLRESAEPLGAITFSAGITTLPPGEALESALARADTALYAAKEAGRNCVRELLEVGA
jgi:diguanylate cyclase